jgi:hypothetical protein
MVLGVYWYYGFPEGLYHFDFFAFKRGQGGHADGPAELTATVRAPDPAALLAAVQAVAARYPEGYIFGKSHGAVLHLDLGDYALTDYTFHVAGELEKVLRQHRATRTTEPLPPDTPLLRLAAPHDPTPPYSYGDGRFQAVSSGPRGHQAQTACLSLSCHLPQARQADFLAALEALCEQFSLDVLYYYDKAVAPDVNLIVLFGNGRQGVGGRPLRYTDTAALRTAVLACLAEHDGQTGHLGSFPDQYPRRGPHVIRMADADFVL